MESKTFFTIQILCYTSKKKPIETFKKYENVILSHIGFMLGSNGMTTWHSPQVSRSLTEKKDFI